MMTHYYESPEKRYGKQFFDYAMDFRRIALVIDEKPSEIMRYVSLPGIQFLLSDRHSTAYERTCYLEAFAYGDPGALLASPGPSLSGLMLRELGTTEQIDHFYETILSHQMRTFFALTEINQGSDANTIQTQISKRNDHYVLNGQKCFFGNGAVAETGIVLARMHKGPVGIRAIWMTPEIMMHAKIDRITLPMFALRGAQIAEMQFHDVVIPPECILGQHRSACENGLLSVLKVFNRLRTGVGALAIGQAQAVYDIVYQLNKSKMIIDRSFFSDLQMRLEVSRQLLLGAARKADDNPFAFYPVSAAKITATRTAEKVINACFDLCSLEQLMENPWLIKAQRDVYCWEYMEGTTAIQKNQIHSQLSHIIKGTYDETVPLFVAA